MAWEGSLSLMISQDMAEVAERARDAMSHAGSIWTFDIGHIGRVFTPMTAEERYQNREHLRFVNRRYRARPENAARLRFLNRERMRRRYATPEGRAAQREAARRYRARLREKNCRQKAEKE